jgi:hypothetical protein
MTPKEAFKIGFLEKCAADNLSPTEIMARIQHSKFVIKSAGIAGPIGDTAKAFMNWAGPLALIGPPVAGLAGGAMLAGAQDDSYDPEEARKQEEIAEYRRAIDQLQNLQRKQQANAGLN